MDDLVQFLRARLAEDEQIAHIGDATEPPLSFRQIGDTGVIVASDGKHAEECANGNWTGIAEHIVRHDPARVLAEVGAKRRLLEAHGPLNVEGDPFTGCTTCSWRDEMDELWVRWPCPTLRLLALPYASHPNYRPEWAPDPA